MAKQQQNTDLSKLDRLDDFRAKIEKSKKDINYPLTEKAKDSYAMHVAEYKLSLADAQEILLIGTLYLEINPLDPISMISTVEGNSVGIAVTIIVISSYHHSVRIVYNANTSKLRIYSWTPYFNGLIKRYLIAKGLGYIE